MADVDLIPGDYGKGRLVRRRVRQLAGACIAVAVVVGAARAAIGGAMALERSSITRLTKDGEMSARAKSEADAYRRQSVLAEKQLAELEVLRGGDRLRLLMQAIDNAWVEGIWMDEIRFSRPAGGTSTALPAGGQTGILVVPKPGAVAPETPMQLVELVGHAANHTRLAEFMRSLGAQPGVAEVRLQDSSLGAHAGTPVVDLTLHLVLQQKAGRQ